MSFFVLVIVHGVPTLVGGESGEIDNDVPVITCININPLRGT